MGLTKKIKAVITVVALLGGGIIGAVASKPGMNGIDNRFGAVNQEETLVHTSIRYANPNPVSVALGDLVVEYTLKMNGIDMAAGVKEGVQIREGNNTVNLTTALKNQNIPEWWVSHLRSEEHTTVEIVPRLSYGQFDISKYIDTPDITRSVDTDLLSRMQITEEKPITYQGQDILVLRGVTSTWGAVSETNTGIITDVTLYNPRTTPVPLTQLSYTADMNNVTLAQGKSTDVAVIQPKQEKTVTVNTQLNNQHLDTWWVTHIEQDEYSTLNLDFDATVDLTAATLRFDLCTYSKGFYTDFLGYRGNRTGDAHTVCMENVRSIGDSGNVTDDGEDLLDNTTTGLTGNNTTDSSENDTLDPLL